MLKTVFCLESNFFNIVFNVSFDQCNVPLLNKSIDFFQQQKKNRTDPNILHLHLHLII